MTVAAWLNAMMLMLTPILIMLLLLVTNNCDAFPEVYREASRLHDHIAQSIQLDKVLVQLPDSEQIW